MPRSRSVLLVESGDSLECVDVPFGVSGLHFPPAAPLPVCVPWSASRAPRRDVALLEVVADTARGLRLLILAPPGIAARINGLSAPPVSPLRIGDVLAIGSQSPLFVSEYQRLEIVAAPRDQWGRPCALCFTPFDEHSRVHLCARCGVARHCGNGSLGDADPIDPNGGGVLDCARLGPCPSCDEPVPLHDGLAYRPGA